MVLVKNIILPRFNGSPLDDEFVFIPVDDEIIYYDFMVNNESSSLSYYRQYFAPEGTLSNKKIFLKLNIINTHSSNKKKKRGTKFLSFLYFKFLLSQKEKALTFVYLDPLLHDPFHNTPNINHQIYHIYSQSPFHCINTPILENG